MVSGPYSKIISSVPDPTIDSSNLAQTNYNGVYVGFVKDTTDVQRMGRIKVWIPLLGGDTNNPVYWHTLSYCTPFGGATCVDDNVKNSKIWTESQRAYGFWMVPPDLENEVICMFIGGDPARGIWIGSLYQQNMNHMVPGIAMNVAWQNDGVPSPYPPVVEYNKRDVGINPDNPIRPRFEPLHGQEPEHIGGFYWEGLYFDKLRGPTNSSARREAPSQVFGINSPQGHHIYIDDGYINVTKKNNKQIVERVKDSPEFIRIRTRHGTQVLVNDTTGFVYMNSRKGNSWVELSDDGVDVYSQLSVSLRSQRDINLHADRHIIMYAGEQIRAHAVDKIKTTSVQETEIKSHKRVVQSETWMPNIHVNNCFANKSWGAIIPPAGPGEEPPAVPLRRFVDRVLEPPVYPPTMRETSTFRTPTHEPWDEHPKGMFKGKSDTGQLGVSGGGFPIIAPIGEPIEQPRPFETPPQESAPTDKPEKTGDGKDRPTSDPTNFKFDGKCGKPPIRDDVKAAIFDASQKTGIDPNLMFAVAEQESGFRPEVKAKTSSATGLYQFIDGTWSGMVNKYGAQTGIGLGDRKDPKANAVMGGLFMSDNKKFLEKKLGAGNVNNTDIYMAHFLGAGGASKFLSAPKDASAVDTMGVKVAQANRSIFYKPDGTPRTNQEVYNIMDQKIQSKTAKYNACLGSEGKTSPQ